MEILYSCFTRKPRPQNLTYSFLVKFDKRQQARVDPQAGTPGSFWAHSSTTWAAQGKQQALGCMCMM
jgi:hypothetical protein